MKFIPPTKDEWAFFLLFCKVKEKAKYSNANNLYEKLK